MSPLVKLFLSSILHKVNTNPQKRWYKSILLHFYGKEKDLAIEIQRRTKECCYLQQERIIVHFQEPTGQLGDNLADKFCILIQIGKPVESMLNHISCIHGTNLVLITILKIILHG